MAIRLFLLIPLLFLSLASAQELLTNGDFEQEITVGWVWTYSGSGTHLADRQVGYHPDPDYEAHTYQYDNPGESRLAQKVETPGVMLELSFWAKFEEGAGSSTCWPAACFAVCYYDAADVLLGETRFYYSTYANWTPSPTLSLYRITNPDWQQYTLNIADELNQNLPGVNPADVAKIEVALWSVTVSG